METLGAPVSVGVALAVLVVAIATSGVVGKSRGVLVGGPLVETLGRPVGVGVTRTVLVVAIAASGVVGKGRGVAGLSLPLVLQLLAGLESGGLARTKLVVAVSASRMVALGLLVLNLGVEIALAVLALGAGNLVDDEVLVAILSLDVIEVGELDREGGGGGPLVETLGRPVGVGVALAVLVVAVAASRVVGQGRGVIGGRGGGPETEDNKL